jgi:K+-transporting ATPase KdpF subunit
VSAATAVAAAAVVVAMLGYLFYTLLRPEKF